MAAASKLFSVFKPTDEVAEWNKTVEAKKQLKLARKGKSK